MCPKVSEKPKRVYFLGLRMLKNFQYKLMIIASLLYTILAYERFHKNALLSDSKGHLPVPLRFYRTNQLNDLGISNFNEH